MTFLRLNRNKTFVSFCNLVTKLPCLQYAWAEWTYSSLSNSEQRKINEFLILLCWHFIVLMNVLYLFDKKLLLQTMDLALKKKKNCYGNTDTFVWTRCKFCSSCSSCYFWLTLSLPDKHFQNTWEKKNEVETCLWADWIQGNVMHTLLLSFLSPKKMGK